MLERRTRPTTHDNEHHRRIAPRERRRTGSPGSGVSAFAGLLAVVLLIAISGCSAPGAFGSMDDRSAAASAQATRANEVAAPVDVGPVMAASDPWVCPQEPLAPQYQPTLYVAADGSDEHDGRSPDRPLRTLQRAADTVRPGDVVWVGGGVHSSDVEFTVSGTPSEPIVFESRPGECAVLDGAEVQGGRRVAFKNVQHMVFRNFVVRNSPGEGIYLVDSSDNVLSNLRTHDNYYSGITSLAGDRNLFTYVISHDNADTRGGDADGISISSGDRNRIEHCVTYGNSDDGVDTWRSTHTLVQRCISFRNGHQGGDGNGFKAGGARVTVNTVVRYSIAFENRSNGFDYNTGGQVTFDHNTSFANGEYGFVATGAMLRNNLSIDNGAGSWYGEAQDGELFGNSWNLEITAPEFASTSDSSQDFLRLDDSSRAVDAGVDVGLPYTGSAPDLGALESGETIASSMSVNLAGVMEAAQR